MSYNGSGTFVINTAGQPVITGTTISSTTFNSLTADLATGLTTALTKDGQSTPTANIGMGAFKITNLAAGTVASDAARLDQVQGGTSTYITVTGTDTITGTVLPALAAYAAGNQFSFVVANTNTAAVTINIDGMGAKAITRTGSTALVAGDMVAGQAVEIIYDGTRFQLINGNSFTNVKVSGLTALLPIFTDASKGLVSNAMTGTGSVVMSTSPILVTPDLGTPTSANLANCTFPTFNQDTTGTAAKANALNSATTIINVSSSPAPSAGEVLTAQSGTAATWVTPGSGAMVFLSTITATASSTVDVETTFNSTYDAYALVITDMRTSTSADIRARLKINGTYQTTGYDYHCVRVDSTTTAYTADAGNSFAYITFSGANMNPPSYSGSTSNYVLYTHNPTSTSRYKNIYWSGFLTSNSGNLVYNHGAGSYMTATQAMTGIRFYGSTGTLSGTFRLYGIKNS